MVNLSEKVARLDRNGSSWVLFSGLLLRLGVPRDTGDRQESMVSCGN